MMKEDRFWQIIEETCGDTPCLWQKYGWHTDS